MVNKKGFVGFAVVLFVALAVAVVGYVHFSGTGVQFSPTGSNVLYGTSSSSSYSSMSVRSSSSSYSSYSSMYYSSSSVSRSSSYPIQSSSSYYPIQSSSSVSGYTKCYSCIGPGTPAIPINTPSTCPNGWFTTQPNCYAQPCYQCTSDGNIATMNYQSTCAAGWSRTKPTSCTITCKRCNGISGAIESVAITGSPSSSLLFCPPDSPPAGYSPWSLAGPSSCSGACYYCPITTGGLLTLYNQPYCQGFYTRTKPASCYAPCYQCGIGESTGLKIDNTQQNCASGWSHTRPTSCGMCYRCFNGNNLEAPRTMPADLAYKSCADAYGSAWKPYCGS